MSRKEGGTESAGRKQNKEGKEDSGGCKRVTFCTICGRLAVNGIDLCRYHHEALDNLKEAYELWRDASSLSWEEYIDTLCQLEETGQWVFDVANQIRSGYVPSTQT
jgi:hypothetical protein